MNRNEEQLHIQQTTENLPQSLKKSVVAIGNFDGVHRGHRQVLSQALSIARENDQTALVLTFEPHPRTWFRPDVPVFRLTPAKLKADLLESMGFDGLIEQKFDQSFSELSALEFVENILVENLDVDHVVVGFDFHFGKKRQGSPEYLENASRQLDFGISLISAYSDHDGQIVSSSAIRTALSLGDIAQANDLLGYSYRVVGEVIKGKQIGRTLGYPTANVALPNEVSLALGIYAVRVLRANGNYYDAVASFGRRPTFDNGEVILEVFLFDFKGDLYGEEITVEFHKKLREEKKFDSMQELVNQMDQDSLSARKVLIALSNNRVDQG